MCVLLCNSLQTCLQISHFIATLIPTATTYQRLYSQQIQKKDYIHVAFFADTECLGADKSSLMQIRFIRLSLNSFGFCLNLSKKV